MFSFFDKRSMEAADLTKLLAQIKEQIIEISYAKIPVIHHLSGDIYYFNYEDFSSQYDDRAEYSTENKIAFAIGDLYRLFEVSHCLEGYMSRFTDLIKWFPVPEDIIPNHPDQVDKSKALAYYDKNINAIKPLYKHLQIKIAKYIHHLLFLETNASVPAKYFFGAFAQGDIFSLKVIDSLEKQGVLAKQDRRKLQDKIVQRHRDIAASSMFTVDMDCSP
jgi:hypothetical protein